MPRGRPKKNPIIISDNAKIPVDNVNLSANLGAATAPQVSLPETPLAALPEKSEVISLPKESNKLSMSGKDFDYVEDNNQNIPVINWPGHVVIWAHNVKGSTIPNLLRKGYQMVPQDILEKNNAERVVGAGQAKSGERAVYYPMYMEEARYKELMARESEQRNQREASIKLRPNSNSSAIYGTQDMSFTRALENPKMG